MDHFFQEIGPGYQYAVTKRRHWMQMRVTDGMSERECASLRADRRGKGRSGHKVSGSSEPLSEEDARGGSR